MSTTLEGPSTRAESLAQALEAQILQAKGDGTLRLGTKSDLRDRFGVAAATVNEAIRILQGRDMVLVRPGPGGGVFGKRPTSLIALGQKLLTIRSSEVPFQDCLELRNALEQLATLNAVGSCTPQQAERIREAAQQVEDATDMTSFLLRNWELHREIGRSGHNQLLATVYAAVVEVMLESVSNVSDQLFPDGAPDDIDDRKAIHRELAEAVLATDLPRTRRALEQHGQEQVNLAVFAS